MSDISPAEILYDRNRVTNRPTLIQTIEPVIGLTPEEQQQQEEYPDLTLEELLGLSSCEENTATPLLTLDGLYVNQPSRFLPLAQEAKKNG